MRLLAVVEYYPPILGHDLRIYELARRLPKDWEVHFLVLPSLRRMMEGDTSTSAGPADGRIVPEPVGVPPWLRGLWRKTWIAPYFLSLGILGLRTARVAKRVRPDLVLANYPSPYTGLLAYLLSRIRSVPYVADLCDDIVAYFAAVFPSARPGRLEGPARRVQEFLVRRSAVLPAVTESLKAYAVVEGVAADRVEVIPNGVDTELFEAASPGDGTTTSSVDRLRCFYGGSLESWAGSTLILEMARLALASDPTITFVVAGNGWDRGGPLPANLSYVGLLDKEEVARTLKACDCVLVPLQPGRVADATSPVKLFEGLAAGKPCLCSKACGIEDIVTDGENGLLIDSTDPHEWLDQLRMLSRDAPLRERLAENARMTSARYDWSMLAKSMEELLREATGRG